MHIRDPDARSVQRRTWPPARRVTLEMLPHWLAEELNEHRLRFAPVWRGFLSDHLPMSSMAMWHLGFDRSDILRWMDAYRRRLEPAPASAPVDDFEHALGDAARYRSLIEYFDKEQSTLGMAETARRYLPAMISGWGADAFHPMIRLGYAIRFEHQGEVSAALAYLAVKGPNRELERLARSCVDGSIVWPKQIVLKGRTFDERYEDCVRRRPPTVRLPPDPLSTYAAELLAVLRASQDFFALHLVTATHAFAIVSANLNLENPGHYAAGIVTGYCAAGSPTRTSNDLLRPERFGFDHDVKLAFALSDMARILNSDPFRHTAEIYMGNLPDIETALEELAGEPRA